MSWSASQKVHRISGIQLNNANWVKSVIMKQHWRCAPKETVWRECLRKREQTSKGKKMLKTMF